MFTKRKDGGGLKAAMAAAEDGKVVHIYAPDVQQRIEAVRTAQRRIIKIRDELRDAVEHYDEAKRLLIQDFNGLDLGVTAHEDQ
jgi:L-lactate utilization protein LutB